MLFHTSVSAALPPSRRGRWRPFPVVLIAALAAGLWAGAGGLAAPAQAAPNGRVDAVRTVAVQGPHRAPVGHPTHGAETGEAPASALPELGLFEPCFKGKLSVGSTVTTVLGPVEEAAKHVHIEYQWLRDGEEIPGATSKSYTLVDADAGASVAVRITATKPGFATEVRTSCTRKISTKPPVTPRAVKLAGDAQVGGTLRVIGASWGDDVRMQYRWACDHETFKVTTKSRLTLKREQAGCRISVAARGYATGKASAVMVTDHPEVARLTMSVAPPQIGLATAAGLYAAASVKAGSALGAVLVPEAAYPDFAVTWEWLANGETIPGQSGDTYAVAWEYAGRTISARATATATGYEPVVATTAGITVDEVIHPTVPPGETHRARGS
jgi:hypothetical protein